MIPLVITMHIFEKIILTEIHNPVTVFSDKGRRFSSECRPFFGLSFCTSGQITYTQNGKNYVSNPYNAVILPKNARYKLYGDAEGLFYVINFQCMNLDIQDITLIPIQDTAQYLKDVQSLSHCFLRDHNQLRQFKILYGILEKLDTEQTINPLSSIIGYIETHIADTDLSNAFLAQKMGISEVYLRRLFIAHTGVTPKQYILELRIKTAQQLLISTTKSITEVAETCGFSSVYHFCRIFKRKTTLTPTQYIAKNRTHNV